MYTEEYEKRGFPIWSFIIRFIIIVILIILLIWLVPKIINAGSNSNANNKCKGTVCESTGQKAESSQIFANNIERMKEAAISYYTADRLPANVGESNQMTLATMIEKKLIVSLVDKNNMEVDKEKSYVKITKMDDEYILKINIKDSEKEDYILVHLGCYSYCDTYLCQKEKATATGTKSATTPVVVISTPSPSPSYSPTPTAVVTPKCQEVSGKFYDANGNRVSEVEYLKSCRAPKCEIINGYYFGKTGKSVTKSKYEKECGTPTYSCVQKDGKYYDKNGNVVSEVDFIISCKAPKCQIVNGYYFGKDGRNVSKAVYEKECGTTTYLYEYQKTTNASFTEWSKWSGWKNTSCETQEINCNDADIKCLYKLQILKRKEKIGTYQKTYEKTRQVQKQLATYEQKACANYRYVKIDTTTYVTTTTTTYTAINSVTGSTQASVGGWTYNGRSSYANPPTDTATTHYIFAGADYSYCGETCTSLPSYYYDTYTYGGAEEVISTTTAPGTTSTIYQGSCTSYITQTIPIYGTITVTEKASRTEPLYGDVCYKSTKSRTLISAGTTQTKWSVYNDQSLLNDGWTYTGRYKVQ